MKTATFTRAIEFASRVVERRNTIPVLGMVKLEAMAGGRSRISGTDMDVQVDVEFEGEAGWEGMLPMASSVAQGLRSIGNDLVEIFPLPADRAGLKISSGDFSLEVDSSIPATDWPSLEHIAVEHTAEIGPDFIKGLQQVRGAVSTEETRYYLNGVYLHKVKNETWTYAMVCTDGHRLYKKLIQIPEFGDIPNVIIPRKTVSLLLGLVNKKTDRLKIIIGRRTKGNNPDGTLDVDRTGVPLVRFSAQNEDHSITITSKTIDGTFPDYTRVIPQFDGVTPFEAVFNTADLRRKIVALGFGNERRQTVALTIKFFKGRADIECWWGAREAKATLSVPYEGDAHRAPTPVLGINRRYLHDMLETMNGAEETMFKFSPIALATDPMRVQGNGMDDFTAVIMPMRV